MYTSKSTKRKRLKKWKNKREEDDKWWLNPLSGKWEQSVHKIKIKQWWALLIISTTEKPNNSHHKALHLLFLFSVLFLTLWFLMWGQTHVWNEKSSPLVQQQISQVDWADGVSVWSPARIFEHGPHGFSMVQGCAGARPAPADRTPLRSGQLPGWSECSEWTHGDRSWCGHPCSSQLSFPRLHHRFPG